VLNTQSILHQLYPRSTYTSPSILPYTQHVDIPRFSQTSPITPRPLHFETTTSKDETSLRRRLFRTPLRGKCATTCAITTPWARCFGTLTQTRASLGPLVERWSSARKIAAFFSIWYGVFWLVGKRNYYGAICGGLDNDDGVVGQIEA
jgi:hypothetical protein